jgi:hypothetical protein
MEWLKDIGVLADQKLQPMGGATNLGLALLANSGYSTTPRSFGQTLGISALQAQQSAVQQQQLRAEKEMEEIRKRYMEAQIAAMQGKPEGYTLSPGQVRYDASGKQIASAPATDNLTGDLEEYTRGQTLGLIPKELGFLDYQKRKRAAGATTINLGAQGLSAPPTGYTRPDPLKPGLMIEPGGPEDPKNKPKPVPTEGERGAANYLGRMQAAEKLLGNTTPHIADYVAYQSVVEGGPTRSVLANQALSSEGQQYFQAAADWVRAKLRKESGATIPPEEMIQEIRTYFPMPGDSPRVIEQKRRARLQAEQGMKTMAGRAAEEQVFAPAENDPLGILPK